MTWRASSHIKVGATSHISSGMTGLLPYSNVSTHGCAQPTWYMVLAVCVLQASISCIGSRALYIEVVCHHTGRPRKTITAQKERMTLVLSQTASGFSGGGCFRATEAISGSREVVFGGPALIFPCVQPLPSSSPSPGAILTPYTSSAGEEMRSRFTPSVEEKYGILCSPSCSNTNSSTKL